MVKGELTPLTLAFSLEKGIKEVLVVCILIDEIREILHTTRHTANKRVFDQQPIKYRHVVMWYNVGISCYQYRDICAPFSWRQQPFHPKVLRRQRTITKKSFTIYRHSKHFTSTKTMKGDLLLLFALLANWGEFFCAKHFKNQLIILLWISNMNVDRSYFLNGNSLHANLWQPRYLIHIYSIKMAKDSTLHRTMSQIYDIIYKKTKLLLRMIDSISLLNAT